MNMCVEVSQSGKSRNSSHKSVVQDLIFEEVHRISSNLNGQMLLDLRKSFEKYTS